MGEVLRCQPDFRPEFRSRILPAGARDHDVPEAIAAKKQCGEESDVGVAPGSDGGWGRGSLSNDPRAVHHFLVLLGHMIVQSVESNIGFAVCYKALDGTKMAVLLM